MCDRNNTPSSLILRSFASDMTWKPPGIGQDRPIPVHEFVQAAQPGDSLGAGTQHQMIGVAQKNIGAGLSHAFGQHGLDRRRRTHRHEGGGADFSAARYGPSPRRAAASVLKPAVGTELHS